MTNFSDKWDRKENPLTKKYVIAVESTLQADKFSRKYHPQHKVTSYFKPKHNTIKDFEEGELVFYKIVCSCGFFKSVKPWWKFW